MSHEPGTDGNDRPATSVSELVEDTHVSIKVNGARIEVTTRVTVREIVEKANAAGAISGFIEEYVVERVAKVGEHGLDETIEVEEEEEFMAIPTGPTEVALWLPQGCP